MDQPRYILIAGVNGAGKSSLYELQPHIVTGTQRINADEILKQNHGDWHRQMDNFRAMRDELSKINSAILQRKSVHIETTLAGNGKTHLELIEQAKNYGFQTELIYITLDQVQTAIKRVNQRVAKGGHGVVPQLIIKRYSQSLNNLPRIAARCDQVMVYDNTNRLTLIYSQSKGRIDYDRFTDYPWLNHLESQVPF